MDFEKILSRILFFFAWFFAGFHLLFNYCKNPNKFLNSNQFFLFRQKNPICHSNFSYCFWQKYSFWTEAHLVRFCYFVIFNSCKWQNLSANYKNNGILYVKMFCQNKTKCLGWCSKNQNEIFTLKSFILFYLYILHTAFNLIFTTMHHTEKGSK